VASVFLLPSSRPTLSNLLKLADDGYYLCFGEFGTGAVALLVPPLAAL